MLRANIKNKLKWPELRFLIIFFSLTAIFYFGTYIGIPYYLNSPQFSDIFYNSLKIHIPIINFSLSAAYFVSASLSSSFSVIITAFLYQKGYLDALSSLTRVISSFRAKFSSNQPELQRQAEQIQQLNKQIQQLNTEKKLLENQLQNENTIAMQLIALDRKQLDTEMQSLKRQLQKAKNKLKQMKENMLHKRDLNDLETVKDIVRMHIDKIAKICPAKTEALFNQVAVEGAKSNNQIKAIVKNEFKDSVLYKQDLDELVTDLSVINQIANREKDEFNFKSGITYNKFDIAEMVREAAIVSILQRTRSKATVIDTHEKYELKKEIKSCTKELSLYPKIVSKLLPIITNPNVKDINIETLLEKEVANQNIDEAKLQPLKSELTQLEKLAKSGSSKFGKNADNKKFTQAIKSFASEITNKRQQKEAKRKLQEEAFKQLGI